MFTSEQTQEIAAQIKAPYVRVQYANLGGDHRAHLMFAVSLDEPSTWANGIFENSRCFRMSVGKDKKMEQFSGYTAKKFRKAICKDLADAIARINKFIAENNALQSA